MIVDNLKVGDRVFYVDIRKVGPGVTASIKDGYIKQVGTFIWDWVITIDGEDVSFNYYKVSHYFGNTENDAAYNLVRMITDKKESLELSYEDVKAELVVALELQNKLKEGK